MKDELLFACVIDNKKIFKEIMKIKKSRGRFRDYAYRRILKDIINYLITNKIIKKEDNIKITFVIDENNLLSNTKRLLSKDIYKELKYGFINQKYYIKFNEVVKGKVFIKISYVNSKNNLLVQASDLVAGKVRKDVIGNKKTNYIDIIRFLP